MPERDWQADWEMCEKACPAPWKIKKAKVCDFNSGKDYHETVSIGPLEVSASADDSYVCVDTWLDVSENDAYFVAEAREALPYWLQRVRELERDLSEALQNVSAFEQLWLQCQEENAKLRRVIEAAGITLNDAMIIERHLSEMGEGAKWRK
jgi:site-specific recombinase